MLNSTGKAEQFIPELIRFDEIMDVLWSDQIPLVRREIVQPVPDRVRIRDQRRVLDRDEVAFPQEEV